MAAPFPSQLPGSVRAGATCVPYPPGRPGHARHHPRRHAVADPAVPDPARRRSQPVQGLRHQAQPLSVSGINAGLRGGQQPGRSPGIPCTSGSCRNTGPGGEGGGGNVTLTGGGGDIPWSIKGNTIGGNLTISGVTADWLGVQFNGIRGNATLTNITATDPGDPGPDRRRRRKQGRAEPQLHGTGPGRIRRFNPRRGQPRQRQRDRSVRIPGLTSFAPPSATPGLKRWRTGAVTSGFRQAYGVLPNHTLHHDLPLTTCGGPNT